MLIKRGDNLPITNVFEVNPLEDKSIEEDADLNKLLEKEVSNKKQTPKTEN